MHSLRGWPTPLGVAVNSAEAKFDGLGGCTNAEVTSRLHTVGVQVVEFALAHR